MWAKLKTSKGFTIVELLITIIIIGILATLVTVNYNNAQTKTKATDEMSDLKTLNRAIQAYFAENSVYPTTGGAWWGWGQVQDEYFIPGLAPKYIPKTPQQKDTSSGSETTYLYRSDGTNYKLISHRPGGVQAVCTTAIGITPAMADPARANNPVPNCWAFGIWSEIPAGTDGAKWW